MGKKGSTTGDAPTKAPTDAPPDSAPPTGQPQHPDGDDWALAEEVGVGDIAQEGRGIKEEVITTEEEEEDPDQPGPSSRPRRRKRKREVVVVEWEPRAKVPLPIQAGPEGVPEELPDAPHQIPGFDAARYYRLSRETPLRFRRGPAQRTRFRLRILDLPETEHVAELAAMILAIGSHAFHHLIRRTDPNSVGQIHIRNDVVNGYWSTKLRPARELSWEEAAEIIVKMLQSGGDDFLLDDCIFDLVTFVPVRIGVRPKSIAARQGGSIAEHLKNKRCFVDPLAPSSTRGTDQTNMCLPLCVVLGRKMHQLNYKAYSKEPGTKEAAKVFHNFCKTLAVCQEGQELVREAGVEPELGPFAPEQAGAFQRVLGDQFQISLYDDNEAPFASFGPPNAPRHINIFVHEADERLHAVLITSMPAFFGKLRFCELCKTGFKATHGCSGAKCLLCRNPDCANQEPPALPLLARCEDCGLRFRTPACHLAHKETTCAKRRRCRLCWNMGPTSTFAKHACGQPRCKHCGKAHLPFQHCRVQPDKGKGVLSGESGEEEDEAMEVWALDEEAIQAIDKDSLPNKSSKKDRRVVYGDAETVTNESGDHKAILLVFQWENTEGDVQEKVYTGPSAVDDFVQDLTKADSIYKDSTIFFHNGGRFDNHLILPQLLRQKMPPRLIAKSQTLISMELRQNNIGFKDTAQFLPGTPLSKFPAMFALESGDKGHFPYKLPEKWLDFGEPEKPYEEEGRRFPALELFHPEAMRPGPLAKLQVWHAEEEAKYLADPAKAYRPVQELLKYCRQDVRILRQGFQAYRRNWLQTFPDMDPAHHLTFPQFNNAVFRNHFMRDEICLLPPQGFSDKQSKMAYAWLHCVKEELKAEGAEVVLERTGQKGFEVVIAGAKVDGFFKDSLGHQHVLQFHGCFWHGCPECGKGQEAREKKVKNAETLERSQRLRDLAEDPDSPYGAFVYHEMWEHDFRLWLRKGQPHAQKIRSFLSKLPSEPLSPREGFFGGRTNSVVHTISEVKEGSTLAYLDFTSLYPAVMWGTDGQEWPVGFPNIYVGLEVDEEPAPKLEDAFGLWKLTVHPPRHLRHPVLGQSINDKLVFALCRTCAETEQQGFCEHSKAERALHGTFFTEELKKAVEMGYELEVPESVWDWPPEQRSQTMFRDMIGSQYVQKVLASPVQSEEDLLEKIEELERLSGKTFTRDDFKEDPATRANAKFSINNIWGYLGKRSDVESSEFLGSLAKASSRLRDPEREVTFVDVVCDGDYLLLRSKPKEEKAGRNGNIVLALMTTAYARLQLYKVIAEYSEEVVYFDTDSVFLLLPPGRQPPKTSNLLGELKNEILEAFGPGFTIGSFTSLGPKTYKYTVVDREGRVVKTEIKTKGISLTSAAGEVATPAAMEGLARERDSAVRVPQFRIARDLDQGSLFSVDQMKRLRWSSSKRWLLPDPNPTLDTLPFGFCLS